MQRQFIYLCRSYIVNLLLVGVLLWTPVVVHGAAYVDYPASTTATWSGTTANNVAVQQGDELPIFRFTPTAITGENTINLVQWFEGIYRQQPVQEDTYLEYARYSVLNQETNAVLEQYGASGGFYAYNATEAFSQTMRGPIDSRTVQELACRFLLVNELFPENVLTPRPENCDFTGIRQLPYSVSLVQTSGENVETGELLPAQVIAASVQIPMGIDTSGYGQISDVPLGGPGGHISLLFRTTNPDDQGFSLDSEVPGLSAVALPFYGRVFDVVGSYPVLEPGQVQNAVLEQVQSAYPDAIQINVPDPALVYLVNDAALPQTVMEPSYNFPGITVQIDGAEIVLKDIAMPALVSGPGGFGPTVAITEPASGSIFQEGATVIFKGTINDGAPPYAYSWQLGDGTVLKQEMLAAAGEVAVTTDQLPVVFHDHMPSSVDVYLHVEDADGAIRQSAVSLQPPTSLLTYLPFNANKQSQPTHSSAAAVASVPAAVTANYNFGFEMGSDYPPYGVGGSDLPGVPGDAYGFRNAMLGLGWGQSFGWTNATAWERDWRDCSLGGGDCTYGVDRTDFVYWSGHGSNGGIALPSNVDSTWFPGGNARFQQARWVAFSSCLTLRAQWDPAVNAPIRQWFNSFQGAHMLLGFNGLMADVAFGPRLVDNMRLPSFFGIEFPWAQRTIREAWTLTAFQMNAGRPAYIYATGTNGVDPVNNKLPRAGDPALPRPFPANWYHWVWWND